MSAVHLLGLTALAFLAPLPVERDRLPDPPRGVGWAIGAIVALLLVVTVVPLSLALADKWAMDARAAECRASGGRFVPVPSAVGRDGHRCEVSAR
ncbi:hypothetical protein [Methylobacterium sp. J-068]|uniref:hypothetical protein n=1 Tax=Methylobacterium sp. J-068 TaxID=2836649 RepID=UPI001FB98096|nr:hypothetical protein [Methylobacterium sp. J-068]MCJ2036307.1 hypothetical protein [Methylobacterium sp. J-068]